LRYFSNRNQHNDDRVIYAASRLTDLVICFGNFYMFWIRLSINSTSKG